MATMDIFRFDSSECVRNMQKYLLHYDPFFDHFDDGRCCNCGDFMGDNNLPGMLAYKVSSVNVFLIPHIKKRPPLGAAL